MESIISSLPSTDVEEAKKRSAFLANLGRGRNLPRYNELAPARAKPTPYEPPTDLPTLSYRQVLDMYDEDRKDQPVFSQMTLPEYAQYQNQLGKSQMFDQALTTGIGGGVKRAFAEKSRFFDSPPPDYTLLGMVNKFRGRSDSVPDMVQEAAQSLSAPLGEHWSGVIGEAAHGLPESVADTIPMLVGGPLGVGVTATLNAGGTYEKTGSKGQSLLSGVTSGLIPSVFGKASQAGLNLAGATLRNEAGQLVGETLGQRAAGYAGGQLGAAGLMEFSHQVGQVAAGNGVDLSAEHFVQSAVMQLPFLALDLPTLVKGGQIASAIKAKNATAERARQAEEYNLSIEQGGYRLSRNEEDARREGDRRPLQPDFQDLQVPPIQQSVYAPEFGNVDRPTVTGQPSEGSPEAAGEWAMPSKVGPEPQRGKLLSRNEIDELKAQGEGDAVKSGKYEPAYDKTLFGEKLPSVKTPEQDRTHYGTTDKPVSKPGGGAADYTSDWQVGQTQEGKRVSTSEVLARQAAGYDESKVEPKPVTQQVLETVIKPLVADPNMTSMIKKVKAIYETSLKPEYGVHDVVLDKLSDESLQSSILSHMQENGGDINDATLKTAQGIRNALAEATSKAEKSIFSDESREKIARLRAKMAENRTKATIGGLQHLNVIPEVIDLGISLAKDLIRAGRLKFQEWRESMLDAGAEDNESLVGVWNHTINELGLLDSGDGDSFQTKQRQRMASAVEGLNQLDEAWNALPQDQKGTNKSPLERAAVVRDRILERNQKYNKYAEVDQKMLEALGKLRHNGQVWTDERGVPLARQEQSVRSLLEKAAKWGYQEATKKEQGGQEVFETGVTEEDHERPFVGNEALERAEKLNSTLHKSSGYVFESGLENPGKKNERFVVYKTNKAKQSMDEGFKPERDRATEEDVEPKGRVDETEEERDTARKSLESVTEEGEFVDPVAEALDKSDRVAADSNDSAGDVTLEHKYGVIRSVLQRLTPERLYLDPVKDYKKPGELAARTKIMLEFIMDSRTNLKGDKGKGIDWNKFVALANDRLAPDFRFESDKQANNWWNGTGLGFFTEWFSRQPEVKVSGEGRVKISSPEAESVGAGPSVAEATKALAPKPDEVRLDAVSEARLTTTDFLRSYFSRRGLGPELSQRSIDAVQKLARAAAFFHGSERAEVRLDSLPPDVAGTAIDASIGGTWSPLIRLNKDITSDSFLSVVAGHESFETLLHAINRGEATTQATRSVQNAIEQATNYSVADRRALLETASRTLPKDVDRALLSGLLDYSAADPKEFVSTLAGIHVVDSTTKGGLARFADTLLYGDGYISRALSSVVNTAQSLINAFRGVTSASREGMISDLTTPLKADLRHFNDLFKTVRNSEKTIEDAVSKLTTIDALKPESFWNAVNSGYLPDVGTTGDKALDSGLSEAYARILPKGDEREIGRVAGFASDFVQLAEVHETLRPILGEMLDYQALANDAARNAMSPFYTRDYVRGQTVLGEASKSLQAISKSTKLRSALSDQILSEQHLGRLLNQTELQAHWLKHSLDPNDRTAIREVRQALSDANVIVGQQIVRQASESITHSVARILMSGSDTPYKNALQSADRLVTVGKAQSGLAQLPGGVDPTSLILSITRDLGVAPEKLTVAQMALGDMLGKYSALVKSVSDRPEFVSEQRFGRYAASYQLQGEKLPGRISADSRTELETKIKSLQSGGKLVGEVQRFDNSDQTFTGLRPDIVRAFKDIGEAAYQRVAATQSREVADGMRNGFSGFDSAIEKELSARGIARYTQQRRLAPGREQLDMLENGMRYLSTVPRALAKTWLRDRSEVALLDPTMVQNPSAQKQAKQQVQNVLATESGWASKAKNWSFLYYLGSNLSSALVEQIQPLLAVPAQLTKFGAGIGQGYKYLASAYKTVGEAYLKDRFSDPFVDNMISQLDKGHILEQQTIGNFFDNNDLNGINLSRATDGKITPLSLYEAGKNQAAHVGGLARTLYSRATGLSSRVTAVAASLHAKDLIADGSLAPADAFDYVRRVVTLTAPGSAGRAGRPTGPYSGEETRSAVGVLLSLQGYTNTMYSMFARLGHDAIKSSSLTSASSKAFLQLGATQLLAAGVLGLPGVGLAISVVNAAFPQLNLKSNLRTAVASLAGDDSALGGMFSDVTLRGVPSTLTGVDLSSRLSLANMLGVSDYDGFQMGHLLGAPGGILTNMYRASQFAAQGQFGEAIETAAPTAIKNVLKVFRDGGDVRKPDGSLTYQPTTGEQFAQLIGFTPKKVADMREFNTLAAQQEKTSANEQQRFISRTADLLRSGDLASVRAALLEREHANPDEFSAAEGLKLVVRQMQDQTYPEDPRRGGSKLTLNDRADLLRTYGSSGVAPSEQQRVVQQAHLLQQFGLVGSLDQSDIMKAGYVDLLMQKNPQMTRQQARKKVEEMTRRKPLPTLGGF